MDTPSTAPDEEHTQERPNRRKRRLVVAAVLGALAAVILWLATVTSGIADAIQLLSPFGDNTKISIDYPEHGQISTCATLRGSAPVKDGKVLWIGHSRGRDYLFYLPTREEGDRWRATPRIGSSKNAGDEYIVYAFYLDERHSRWLEGLRATGKDGKPVAVHADGMHPDAKDVVTRTVTHDGSADNADC